jgi:hypothetical protein
MLCQGRDRHGCHLFVGLEAVVVVVMQLMHCRGRIIEHAHVEFRKLRRSSEYHSPFGVKSAYILAAIVPAVLVWGHGMTCVNPMVKDQFVVIQHERRK